LDDLIEIAAREPTAKLSLAGRIRVDARYDHTVSERPKLSMAAFNVFPDMFATIGVRVLLESSL
jgi:hypothetical protein